MARDLDRYGGNRSRYYGRGEEGRRGYAYGDRGSDRDDDRESYSGDRYFYEGRTYASDRDRPGEYGRGYAGEDVRWGRRGRYEDYPERTYETDYDRDRRSRYMGDYDRGRYEYGREYDRGRGYGRRYRGREEDAWNGYGYDPEEERRMMRDEYRGRYSRGEFEHPGDYERPRYDRSDYDRDRPSGSFMNRSDTWDQNYEPYRGEWQTGDRSWTRDYERNPRSRGEEYDYGYDRDRDRNEEWERRRWRRRREMETH